MCGSLQGKCVEVWDRGRARFAPQRIRAAEVSTLDLVAPGNMRLRCRSCPKEVSGRSPRHVLLPRHAVTTTALMGTAVEGMRAVEGVEGEDVESVEENMNRDRRSRLDRRVRTVPPGSASEAQSAALVAQ